MTTHETVLLTGITESIGTWVGGTILQDGGRIVAIVRANTSFAAAERVREVLAVVGAQEYADRVHAVCGDICDAELCKENQVCTFSLHSDPFSAIAGGRPAPQQAFCLRKIHIASDGPVCPFARTIGV
jgi:nucleoside-diphosphate-sugar epimerase